MIQGTRRDQIVRSALELSGVIGYQQITSQSVANRAKCSSALVRLYFDGPSLKDAVMVAAVETERLRVVAQGMACGHPLALAAPRDLRERAAYSLLTE